MKGPALRNACTPALVLVCAAVAFFTLFTEFADYDDEGWLMLVNRLFLDGVTPYRDVSVLYGPLWLAIVELLHGVLGIPIGHDAVRFITLGWWLMLGGAGGLLVHRLTGSRCWALAGLLLAFLFPASIANEPGHPQAFVAILTLLLPLAFNRVVSMRRAAMWSGMTAGAITCIKYNAGAFCLAAIASVIAGRVVNSRHQHHTVLMTSALALASPFVLMLPMLANPDCRSFAAITGMSVAAVALQSAPQSRPHAAGTDVAVFLAGFLSVCAASFAYAAIHGAGPLTVISDLFRYANAQRGFYHFFRTYSGLQLALGALSLGMALTAALGHPRLRRSLAWWGRLMLAGSGVLALAADSPAHAQFALAHVAPWCWVIALRTDGGPSSDPRLVLAAAATWTPLIAYPIPGSQLYFGTLPAMMCALIGLADICAQTSETHHARLFKSLPLLCLSALLALLVARGYSARQLYLRNETLALPGAEILRLAPERSARLRELVRVLADADVVVSATRFHSLSLWRGAPLPAAEGFSVWPLAQASTSERAATLAALRSARNPRVIYRSSIIGDTRIGSVIPGDIESDFDPCARIGPWTVLCPRAVRP